MHLRFRVFLSFVLAILCVIIAVTYQFLTAFKPGVRQSSEHTLVDMSQLLAEFARPLVVEASPFDNVKQREAFSQAVDRFLKRDYQIELYSLPKGPADLHLYVTDKKGIVVFDSRGKAVGEDYSQWNDVYLTLQGKYGARSTQDDPADDYSTVMYVAAPITLDEDIVGVLTIGKPNKLSQPFIELARSKLKETAVIFAIVFTATGGILSIWLTRSIRKLYLYAVAMGQGEPVSLPSISEPELQKLGQAMESMREELDGKATIEKYILALTHELKSPITAIQASSELVTENIPAEDQKRFMKTISTEAQRIDNLVNRLLSLAAIEKQTVLLNKVRINVRRLVESVLISHAALAEKRNIECLAELDKALCVDGDPLLLSQAIDNLMINALAFSPENGRINISLKTDDTRHGWLVLSILDQGPGIPAYALERIYERFYSLPRPDTSKKSSGLGLSFVKQIMELHGGEVCVCNEPEAGVRAVLALPISSPIS